MRVMFGAIDDLETSKNSFLPLQIAIKWTLFMLHSHTLHEIIEQTQILSLDLDLGQPMLVRDSFLFRKCLVGCNSVFTFL